MKSPDGSTPILMPGVRAAGDRRRQEEALGILGYALVLYCPASGS